MAAFFDEASKGVRYYVGKTVRLVENYIGNIETISLCVSDISQMGDYLTGTYRYIIAGGPIIEGEE